MAREQDRKGRRREGAGRERKRKIA